MADYVFKIIVAGEGGVGKTTLLLKFVSGTFVDNTAMTIGVQLHVKPVKGYNLQLWDLGGQQQFRFILGQYVNGAAGALLMYDMTSMRTTLNLDEAWLPILRKQDPSLPIILVGTKKDLVPPDVELIDPGWAEGFVEKHGLQGHLQISSKTGENVEETFEMLVDKIVNHKNL